jgi:hypothetical protein
MKQFVQLDALIAELYIGHDGIGAARSESRATRKKLRT